MPSTRSRDTACRVYTCIYVRMLPFLSFLSSHGTFCASGHFHHVNYTLDDYTYNDATASKIRQLLGRRRFLKKGILLRHERTGKTRESEVGKQIFNVATRYQACKESTSISSLFSNIAIDDSLQSLTDTGMSTLPLQAKQSRSELATSTLKRASSSSSSSGEEEQQW